MEFRVFYMPEAVGVFENDDRDLATHIRRKIEWLASHFEHMTPKPLSGELEDCYKLRVGDRGTIFSITEGLEDLPLHFYEKCEFGAYSEQ